MTDLVLTAAARTAMAEGVNVPAGRALMLAALLAKADAGAVASHIEVYSTPQPGTPGGDPGGPPLATIYLTRPCGTLTGGVASLTQASGTGDLIALDGDAEWARWVGDGVPLADGAVTDEEGDGPFRLLGETGVALYAGGRVVLGTVALS